MSVRQSLVAQLSHLRDTAISTLQRATSIYTARCWPF